MAFLQSLGITALLTIMSYRRAWYGIMVSSYSFRIFPETSGPTDLFLSIAANLLMILVLMAKGSYGWDTEFVRCCVQS
jgi:hypothetical protein